MLAALILAAEEAAAEEGATRFVLPDKHELIWGSIAFVILITFLAKMAWPAVKKMLDERAAKIKEGLESAEKSKTEADRMLEQYRKQLDEARGEAQKIIEEAKRTAESLKADLTKKAEAEAQDIVNRARADVAGEADRARQQLRGELANLSLELASRVIERELAEPETAKQFVDRTIAELAASGNGGGGNGSR